MEWFPNYLKYKILKSCFKFVFLTKKFKEKNQCYVIPKTYFKAMIRNIVATLALGSQPKQGVARLWAKKKTQESHHMLTLECEGSFPHTPK
jgi:hypothetical protein